MPLEHRRYNAIPTEYDPVLKLMLDEVVELKSPPDNPKVLKLVSALLEPPSQHILKHSRTVVDTKQSQEVMKILNKKVPYKWAFYISFSSFLSDCFDGQVQ